MAKNIKKTLALLLAVALCVGQLAIPVFAETTTSAPVTNPDGSVTVTTVITDETGNSVTTIVTNEKETETEHTIKTDTTTESSQEGAATGEKEENVVLDETENPDTHTPGESGSHTSESGDWTNEGQAVDTWGEGTASEEVLSGPVDAGTPQQENLDLDPLAGKDQVTLNFDMPTGDDPATAQVKISITQDLIAQYEANGYEVAPVYDEADPTKVIGWTATKTTSSTSTETTGEAAPTGEGQAVNQSAGVQVSDPELDKALGETSSTEGNVTTTVKLEKAEGAPAYTRTTTVVTVKDPVTGEAVALTEQQKKDLAETIPGQTTTSYNYLTGITELAGSTDAEGNTVSYGYSYVRDADGNILSYTQTTTITDAQGNLIRQGSDTYHCTTVVTTSYTVTDPVSLQTTTVDTVTEITTEDITFTQYTRDLETEIQRTDVTENTYEMESQSFVSVEGSSLIADENGNLYVVYEGKLFAVQDLGREPTANHVVAGSNTSSNHSQDGTWHYEDDYMKGHEVKYTDGDTTTPTMFEIRSGKEVRYVYCVELDQTTNSDGYNLQADFFSGDTNISSAAWSDSVTELRSVAINGFWNTDSGVGSLESVRSLLKRYQDEINKDGVILTDEDIAHLSAADALTATQVALWNYGAKNSNSFGSKFSKDSTVVILRDLLVDLADAAAQDAAGNGTSTEAKELTGDKITGASLIIKDKASETTYNTDLVFKLNVSESAINGNLIVEVVDADNNVLGQYRLAEDGSKTNFFTDVADAATGTKQVKADGSGNYTLEDLVLPNGVQFTVNLRGTQHLDDGVTIYMSQKHQDFIGLVSKDKSVNLSFDMEFTATDTEVEKTTGKQTRTGTISTTYTGTRTQHQVKTSMKVETTEESYTDSASVTRLLGDLVGMEDIYSRTESHSLLTDYLQEAEPIDDGDPNDPPKPPKDPTDPTDPSDPSEPSEPSEPTEPEAQDLTVENVIKAMVPKTGDISLLWSVLSGLSAGGLVLLNRKKED